VARFTWLGVSRFKFDMSPGGSFAGGGGSATAMGTSWGLGLASASVGVGVLGVVLAAVVVTNWGVKLEEGVPFLAAASAMATAAAAAFVFTLLLALTELTVSPSVVSRFGVLGLLADI